MKRLRESGVFSVLNRMHFACYNFTVIPKGNIFKHIDHFFDKFEDHVRAYLSRRPILYAFIAGIAIVLFWRGIWHFADHLESKGGFLGFVFSPEISIIISIAILLATGLFVSFFVGDVIIMSGLKKEKKFVDRAQEELKKETADIEHIEKVLERLEGEIDHIHSDHTLKKDHEPTSEARSGGGVQPKG